MALRFRGLLYGHNGWVTSIAVPEVRKDRDYSNTNLEHMVISGSRDRSILRWRINRGDEEYPEFGKAEKSLKGHSSYVQDVILSKDGQYALSSSWDKTLRLWDLNFGNTSRLFQGHKGDVLSVAFSPDNRQIVSGSRDRSIKLWNTLGECKCSIEDAHSDWVSAVKFSPNPLNPIVVSAGWDKIVKVWTLSKMFKIQTNLVGHTGYVNALAVAPDGSLCATGGKDGTCMLWDLNEGRHLYSLDAGDIINTLTFSPTSYWLCAGTDSGIKIFNLESKAPIQTIDKNTDKDFLAVDSNNPGCLSLAWGNNGSVLYAGYTDNFIRCWGLGSSGYSS